MIDHNHFICHFIFGGHLLNIPKKELHRFLTVDENAFVFGLKRKGVLL